jgi:hypothetical protein
MRKIAILMFNREISYFESLDGYTFTHIYKSKSSIDLDPLQLQYIPQRMTDSSLSFKLPAGTRNPPR